MKAALIPPKGLERFALDSNIHLILPMTVCTSNLDYMRTYREARRRGDFLILDNGCAEGQLVDSATLLSVAKALQVHEIVAPDVMGNAAETWALTNKFLSEVGVQDYSVMAVLQGETFAEAMNLAEAFAQDSRITTFGIPKVLISRMNDDVRARMASRIIDRWPQMKIHLLGLSNKFPTEMLDVVFPDAVRSMDSSQPFKMAEDGVMMTGVNCRRHRPRRREDYFSRASSTNLNILRHNIKVFQDWCA